MPDFIFSLWDQLIQSLFWTAFLSKLGWNDWICFFFLALGLVYGIQNGFMREIAGITEILIVILLVFGAYKSARVVFKMHVTFLDEASASATAFIVVTIIIWGVIGWLGHLMRKTVHTEIFPPIRILGGAVLGVVHFALIWSMITNAISLMPIGSANHTFRKGASVTGYKLLRLAPKIYQTVNEPIDKMQKKKK